MGEFVTTCFPFEWESGLAGGLQGQAQMWERHAQSAEARVPQNHSSTPKVRCKEYGYAEYHENR